MLSADKKSLIDKAHVRRVHRFLMFLSGVVLVAGGIAAAYVAFGYSGRTPRFLLFVERLTAVVHRSNSRGMK